MTKTVSVDLKRSGVIAEHHEKMKIGKGAKEQNQQKIVNMPKATLKLVCQLLNRNQFNILNQLFANQRHLDPNAEVHPSVYPNLSAKNSLLHVASQQGYLECCQVLIKHGAELCPYNSLGYTPIHKATLEGHYRVVAYFLELNKINPDVRTKSQHGTTCLMQATGYGYTEVVKVLLRYLADPLLRDFDGLSCVERIRHEDVRKVYDQCWSINHYLKTLEKNHPLLQTIKSLESDIANVKRFWKRRKQEYFIWYDSKPRNIIANMFADCKKVQLLFDLKMGHWESGDYFEAFVPEIQDEELLSERNGLPDLFEQFLETSDIRHAEFIHNEPNLLFDEKLLSEDSILADLVYRKNSICMFLQRFIDLFEMEDVQGVHELEAAEEIIDLNISNGSFNVGEDLSQRTANGKPLVIDINDPAAGDSSLDTRENTKNRIHHINQAVQKALGHTTDENYEEDGEFETDEDSDDMNPLAGTEKKTENDAQQTGEDKLNNQPNEPTNTDGANPNQFDQTPDDINKSLAPPEANQPHDQSNQPYDQSNQSNQPHDQPNQPYNQTNQPNQPIPDPANSPSEVNNHQNPKDKPGVGHYAHLDDRKDDRNNLTTDTYTDSVTDASEITEDLEPRKVPKPTSLTDIQMMHQYAVSRSTLNAEQCTKVVDWINLKMLKPRNLQNDELELIAKLYLKLLKEEILQAEMFFGFICYRNDFDYSSFLVDEDDAIVYKAVVKQTVRFLKDVIDTPHKTKKKNNEAIKNLKQLQEEYNELFNEKEVLDRKLQSIDVEGYKQEIQSLKNRLEEMEELKKRLEEMEYLKKRLEKMKDLKKKLAEKEEQISGYKSKIYHLEHSNTSTAELSRISEELEALKKVKKTAEHAALQWKQRFEELQRSVNSPDIPTLINEIALLRRSHEEKERILIQNHNIKISNIMKESDTKMKELKEKYDEAMKKLQKYSNEAVSDLIDQRNKLISDIESMEREYTTDVNQKDFKRLSVHYGHLELLKKKIATLEAREDISKQYPKKIEQLQEEISLLRQTQAQLQEEKLQATDVLNKRLIAQNEQLESLRIQISEMEKSNLDREDIKLLQTEISNLRIERENLAKEHSEKVQKLTEDFASKIDQITKNSVLAEVDVKTPKKSFQSEDLSENPTPEIERDFSHAYHEDSKQSPKVQTSRGSIQETSTFVHGNDSSRLKFPTSEEIRQNSQNTSPVSQRMRINPLHNPSSPEKASRVLLDRVDSPSSPNSMRLQGYSIRRKKRLMERSNLESPSHPVHRLNQLIDQDSPTNRSSARSEILPKPESPLKDGIVRNPYVGAIVSNKRRQQMLKRKNKRKSIEAKAKTFHYESNDGDKVVEFEIYEKSNQLKDSLSSQESSYLPESKTSLKVLKSEPILCNYCERRFSNFCCSNCQKAFYCSQECQTKDWNEKHSSVCLL